MNGIKNAFIRFACILLFVSAASACTVKTPEEAAADRRVAEDAAKKWKPAAELKVERSTKAPAEQQLYLLLDVSCSGTSVHRQQAGAEIQALVRNSGLQQHVCMLPIASDSRAEEVWCRQGDAEQECKHEPINPGPYASQKKEGEYKAAKVRLEAELLACQQEVERQNEAARTLERENFKNYLRDLVPASHTDIAGAFYRLTELRKQATGAFDVWVYSDMDEDPMTARVGELPINLENASVHVRQVLRTGAGYKEGGRLKWETRLKSWKADSIDWQDFRYGEFAVIGPLPQVAEGRLVNATPEAVATPSTERRDEPQVHEDEDLVPIAPTTRKIVIDFKDAP